MLIEGGKAAVGLEDLDDLTAMSLRQRFTPQVFNTGRGKTNSASSGVKGYVMLAHNNCCAVCQSQQNITVAHILKLRTDCADLGIPWDATNFVALCGTASDPGTCHFLFDNFQMSFIYVKSKDKWSVVGGGPARHGKLVILATFPRKRSLHSHFTRCLLLKSLIGVDNGGEYVSEPLETSDESDDIING